MLLSQQCLERSHDSKINPSCLCYKFIFLRTDCRVFEHKESISFINKILRKFSKFKKNRGCGLGLHAIRDGSSGLHMVNIQLEDEEVA